MVIVTATMVFFFSSLLKSSGLGMDQHRFSISVKKEVMVVGNSSGGGGDGEIGERA